MQEILCAGAHKRHDLRTRIDTTQATISDACQPPLDARHQNDAMKHPHFARPAMHLQPRKASHRHVQQSHIPVKCARFRQLAIRCTGLAARHTPLRELEPTARSGDTRSKRGETRCVAAAIRNYSGPRRTPMDSSAAAGERAIHSAQTDWPRPYRATMACPSSWSKRSYSRLTTA